MRLPSRPCGSLTPRPRFMLAVGALIAITVSTNQARAEPAPEPAAAVQAVFRNDRLSVEVVGEGPDVVLIPGLASSREVWRPLAGRLKATHRIHLVQLAGFAGEPWGHGDGPLLQPAVEAVAAYIEAQGLRRPAVIGHSMGALTGLMLAQRRPELVGRLLSVDSLPFYSALFGPQVTAEAARPFADQARAGVIAADEAAFRHQQTASAAGLARDPETRARIVEWSMATDRRAMGTALSEVMTADARPGLAAMTVPVTAVYAADADGGAPAALADDLWRGQYAALPGVALIRVDGARHFIMADQPERFAEIVDRFLAD